ncbi:MAG: VanZ family protein [Candidatus Nanohaloarchaea archaeon]
MKRRLNLAAALGTAATISYLSLAPIFSSGPPGTGLGFSLFTLGHFAAYLALAFSTGLYLRGRGTRNSTLLAVAAAVAFGASLEVMQGQLPYRFFGYDDMVYNLTGASLLLLDRSGRLQDFVLETESRVLEASTFNVRR